MFTPLESSGGALNLHPIRKIISNGATSQRHDVNRQNNDYIQRSVWMSILYNKMFFNQLFNIVCHFDIIPTKFNSFPAS